MSKKHSLKVALIIAISLAAASAFATQLIEGAITFGGGSFAPSNNVKICATSTSAAYAAASKHTNGDRVIGTINTDPKMYWKTGAAGTALTNGEVTATTIDFTSGGWTTL